MTPVGQMEQKLATVGSSTYEHLKHDIIYGILEPGRKLKLGQLRDQYNASVSTIRETLNRLASEGFVVAEEQRGFFVKSVSIEDFEEIANLRILLETHALKLSIKNGDTEWEGNLVAAHHKLHTMETRILAGDDSDYELWKRYDWEFHLALIQASDSHELLSLHRTVYDKYLRYQILVLTNRGAPAVEEHRAMFEAALARDVDDAVKHLETHIINGLDHAMPKLEF